MRPSINPCRAFDSRVVLGCSISSLSLTPSLLLARNQKPPANQKMATTRGSPTRRLASVASLAAADAVTTALFVLFSSAWGEAAARLSAASGLSPFRAGLAVLAAGLALFDPVARLVGKIVSPGAGGAPCFNPAHALAIAVASAGTVVSTKAKAASSPLRAAAVRSAAQVAGALAAALAAASAFPKALKDSLPAPAVSASSSLKAAFAAEAVLGAILAFVVIWASVGGGSNKGKRVAVGVPLVATVILTVVGSELASHAPAFNPAVAGAWSWRSLTSSPSALSSGLLTHAAAFWAAPLLGALAAGAVWRIVQEDEKSSGGVWRTAGKARASKARSAAKSKRR